MTTEPRDLVVIEEQVQSLLTGSPTDRVGQATDIANALAPVIQQKNLYKMISNKKHVLYEGWTTLGALVGVFPVTVWTRKTDDGWEARVEARTLAGAVVGAAEAECSRQEENWSRRDDYALRSMAQTRAGSKALRMPLGFIMSLAGYDATPAEEIVERPAPKAKPKTDTEAAQRAVYAVANENWPDMNPHEAICIALNLPDTGEGAMREHWFGLGATWSDAKTALAAVKREQDQSMSTLVEAAAVIDAHKRVVEYKG